MSISGCKAGIPNRNVPTYLDPALGKSREFAAWEWQAAKCSQDSSRNDLDNLLFWTHIWVRVKTKPVKIQSMLLKKKKKKKKYDLHLQSPWKQ